MKAKLAILFAALLLCVPGMAVSGTRGEGLPQVRLWCDNLSAAFADGRFLLLQDNDTLWKGSALLRYRGATSLGLEKKSFAVKLTDAGGGKKNVSLLGMRKDNYWILDAAARDMSRMRNRVSTDLWNDFGRRPASLGEGNLNGTRGQWVELWVNDSYNGLYCLTERIDRKQLGLRKCSGDTIRGLSAKAVKWSDNTCFVLADGDEPDDTSGLWGGFQAEYPSAEDGEPWSWQPVRDMLSVLNSPASDGYAEVAEALVDMPAYIDYMLLVFLIEGEDNMAKNYYLSNHDVTEPGSRWFITPWDMDHSWGRRYDSTLAEASVIKANPLDNHMLPYQLELAGQSLFDSMCRRYTLLRTCGTFSLDSLASRFTGYAEVFSCTGVWEREMERWAGTGLCPPPLDEEMQYIAVWIEERLATLDAFFRYDAISSVTKGGQMHIHFIDGRRAPNVTRKGIYIVNGRKYIVQ